jgi:hypothetical protein
VGGKRFPRHATLPGEFTERIDDLRAPVTWQVDIETADGQIRTAQP